MVKSYSNHTAIDQSRCILYPIGSSNHLNDHTLNADDFPCQKQYAIVRYKVKLNY